MSDPDLATAAWNLAKLSYQYSKYQIKKELVQATCDGMKLYGETFGEMEQSDRAVLWLAEKNEMKPGGRAALFLAHYVQGSGEDMVFPLEDLLTEDIGVRTLVRNHFAGLRLATRTTLQGSLTIRQRNYANEDWRLALGTFFLSYVPYQGVACPGQGLLMTVSGADTYRWHPEDAKRITQCVHEAAERMKSNIVLPAAKDYRIIASPVVVDAWTGEPILGQGLLPRSPLPQSCNLSPFPNLGFGP
jgi:hypothetical protein